MSRFQNAELIVYIVWADTNSATLQWAEEEIYEALKWYKVGEITINKCDS